MMYLSEILCSSAAGKNSPSRVVEFFCSSGCSVEVFLSMGKKMFFENFILFFMLYYYFFLRHHLIKKNITPKTTP